LGEAEICLYRQRECLFVSREHLSTNRERLSWAILGFAEKRQETPRNAKNCPTSVESTSRKNRGYE